MPENRVPRRWGEKTGADCGCLLSICSAASPGTQMQTASRTQRSATHKNFHEAFWETVDFVHDVHVCAGKMPDWQTLCDTLHATVPLKTFEKTISTRTTKYHILPDDDGFFLACKYFGGRFDNSLPAWAFFFFKIFFWSGDQLAHTSSTF